MITTPLSRPRVLVCGSGDVASAVAHRLFAAGYLVLLAAEAQPTTHRRGMAFADAVFDGQAHLAGVTAMRVDDLSSVLAMMDAHAVLPVVVADWARCLPLVQPDVLVDARMQKRAVPEALRGVAPLTLGLGPNFHAGMNVDCAIETQWGDDLGHVIWQGPTQPLAGEPRAIGGHGRDRLVYAPVAGVFRTTYAIGDSVMVGEVVAHIGTVALAAPLVGVLRGLTHDGVPVGVGTKVIEVDPRGDAAGVWGIAERPGRIAAGVLAAIRRVVGGTA
jgi:xanthine dehydrogenase accessory factor